MARDTGGNIAVDYVWGNFPMQPDDDRATPLDKTKSIHGIVSSKWGGFPAFVANNTGTWDDITVPNVVGLTESAANTALVAVGLTKGAVTTTGVGATTVNDGKVKTQTPSAATVINPSDGTADLEVDLVKYLAPTVPDVTGDDEVDAEAALVAAGLTKGAVTTSSDGATAENDGTVKTQTPAAGVKADTGAAVALVLFAYTAPEG